MKQKWLIAALAAVCTATCAVGLTACGDDAETHNHVYSEAWSPNADGTGHCHKCTVEGCTSVTGTTAHEYGEETELTAATCTQAGSKESVCSVCGYHNVQEIPVIAHSYGEWTVSAENLPTSSAAGKAVRVCQSAGCAAYEEYELPVTGSSGYAIVDTSTCEEAGTVSYRYTKNDTTIEFSHAGAALGHDYEDYVSDGAEGHHQVCNRDNSHHSGVVDHTSSASKTIEYNSGSGAYEHFNVSTCSLCKYQISKAKGSEPDLTLSGTVMRKSGSTAITGTGVYADPYKIESLSASTEYTVTVPESGAVRLQFEGRVMTTVGLMVTSGDNAAVVCDGTLNAVQNGKRFKKQFLNDRGGNKVDMLLTTADGEAGSFDFKLIDSDNYVLGGSPSALALDTQYTDTVPEDTWIQHTISFAKDGWYTFAATDKNAYISVSGGGISYAGSTINDTFQKEVIYTVRISTENRAAADITFEVSFDKDIEEPLPGMKGNPHTLQLGETEIEITRSNKGVGFPPQMVYFKLVPETTGLYKFYDEENAKKTKITVYTEGGYAALTAFAQTDITDGSKSYSYVECDLTAGITYYVCVTAYENEDLNVVLHTDLHEHTSNPDSAWLFTATYHYHAATCEHTNAQIDRAGHVLDGDQVCTVCGANINEGSAGLSFELSTDETYYIVSNDSFEDENLVIPAYYGTGADKKPVKEIAESGFSGAGLTSVTLPSTITKINANAFKSNSSLTKIYISDLAAFASIEFTATSAHPFNNQGSTRALPTNTEIYLNGALLTEVSLTVPVADYAFFKCASIQTVILSGATVGSSAFAQCANLAGVTLNEGVETIGASAFNGCTKLTVMTIPSTLTESASAYGSAAGSYKPAITSLYISDMSAYLNITWAAHPMAAGGKLYLNGTEVTSFKASDYPVTAIKAYAFYNCSNLISADLTGVTEIAAYAFYGCSALDTLIVSPTLNTIANKNALNGCSSLTNVYFTGTSEADHKEADETTDRNWVTNGNITNKTIYYYSSETPTQAGNYWSYVGGVPTPYPAAE